METKKKVSSCKECKMRKLAERKPNSFWAKVWRWHTKWCPGWKSYQKKIDKQT